MAIEAKKTVQEGPPFAAGEYAARAERACRSLVAAELDGLLIAEPANICYLTGYETNGIVATTYLFLSQAGDRVFLTRRLDIGNLLPLLDAVAMAEYAVYDDDGDPVAALADLLCRNAFGRGRIGVEKASLYFSVDHYERLGAALAGVELVDSGPLLERLRLVKSAAEIEYHRAAAEVAVAGMKAGIAVCQPGVRDSAVAAAVLAGLVDSGGSWIANWPYIKVGRNTGRGHATWQNAVLGPAMPLTIELAGVVRRYHSPLYRTVIFRPLPEQRRLAETLGAANRAGVAAMAPGKSASEVYAAFKSIVTNGGYGNLLHHRNGYAVGIGFPPNWVQRPGLDVMAGNETRLEAGMVFHVPTYLCLANEHGMGESHTVLITGEGHEVLTRGMPDGPFLHD